MTVLSQNRTTTVPRPAPTIDVMSLDVPGAFAMTETGHGPDVAGTATTATCDPATEEFVLHTPFRAAWKDYLGNAARHASAAVVFARLVDQGAAHGVHAVHLPIRDPRTGRFLPGIGGEDDGPEGGLDGVDNGRLHLDSVRVSRRDLLDRYGAVAPDSTYASPIAGSGRRSSTMLGTLVRGRVSLAGAAVDVAKIGLSIAVACGNQRRKVTAASPVAEVAVLDYAEHRRRLLPRLAQTYAAAFAHERMPESFHDVFSGATDTDADRRTWRPSRPPSGRRPPGSRLTPCRPRARPAAAPGT